MSRSRTVTTTGYGNAGVTPDSAVVRLAVVHRAGGVAEAFAGVDQSARLVGQVARDFTEPARISSANLSVWPAHDAQGRPSGYEARHNLSVSCGDLASAGALLTELARHVGDALVVEGVSLAVTDDSEAQLRARESAFADARARAEHLAGLSGESLGTVLSVVEGGFSGGHEVGRMEFAKAADMMIEPGESTISASVTVTWGFPAAAR